MISRITDKIIPEIYAWQNRPLESKYPIIYIDGIRFKIREESSYLEKSIYIILGINDESYKETICFWITESESAKQWLNIFNEIKSRRIEKIRLVCCDNLKRISEAIRLSFPKYEIQKCVVHQIRNSIKYVSTNEVSEFVSDMKKIYKASSHDNALIAFDDFAGKW